MSRDKTVDECKTYKDFGKLLDHNGYPVVRTNGGHEIHSNGHNSFPLPTHGHEPSHELACRLRKAIKALIGIIIVCAWLYTFFGA